MSPKAEIPAMREELASEATRSGSALLPWSSVRSSWTSPRGVAALGWKCRARLCLVLKK